MNTEIMQIREEIEPLLKKAEREGKWLNCAYQDIWFSPTELREYQMQGKFCWGVVNWRLRDPQEHIEQLDKDIKNL